MESDSKMPANRWEVIAWDGFREWMVNPPSRTRSDARKSANYLGRMFYHAKKVQRVWPAIKIYDRKNKGFVT